MCVNPFKQRPKPNVDHYLGKRWYSEREVGEIPKKELRARCPNCGMEFDLLPDTMDMVLPADEYFKTKKRRVIP